MKHHLGLSSLFLSLGTGFCLLSTMVALAEPRSESNPRSQSPSSAPEATNSFPELPVTTLPKKLHAKSAIEVTGVGLPDSILTSKTNDLLLPISKNKKVALSISHTVQKKDGQTILFGQLANSERSHFALAFEDGKLKSGSLTLFDSEEQYLITALPNGKVVLTLTNPDLQVSSCGCEDCLEKNN